jgi:hypothetical protein
MTDPRYDRGRETRQLTDELIDYAIYAPLGAVLAVADELPELVRRGREHFAPRLALAQMLGRVAVNSARRRAEAFVRRPTAPEPTAPRPEGAASPTEPTEMAPRAIPGYDTLLAAEIVARLAGLTRSELREVRSFEMAHRARRTVLTRIAQLLDDESR